MTQVTITIQSFLNARFYARSCLVRSYRVSLYCSLICFVSTIPTMRKKKITISPPERSTKKSGWWQSMSGLSARMPFNTRKMPPINIIEKPVSINILRNSSHLCLDGRKPSAALQ